MEQHPLPLPLGEVAERSEDGEGRHVKKICRCRHVKKICQWHIFSVDLSGYAAVASFLVSTALSWDALSVTYGDSSPKGRAKGLHVLAQEMERIYTDTLH